jgi:hypothetical protein
VCTSSVESAQAISRVRGRFRSLSRHGNRCGSGVKAHGKFHGVGMRRFFVFHHVEETKKAKRPNTSRTIQGKLLSNRFATWKHTNQQHYDCDNQKNVNISTQRDEPTNPSSHKTGSITNIVQSMSELPSCRISSASSDRNKAGRAARRSAAKATASRVRLLVPVVRQCRNFSRSKDA